ncbi:3',5'-cyclic AMP phosphodiesterase CpdA [Paenibacillus sp. UNCCL117]|uniref:metallophosphoesterase family protein n=1 Tax=unclassified Paenibacillus TaxID=185978 RepID=UPI0008839C1E|nr:MULTISPECIES: metallophosphoesterase family protein [unclassified Paenibacillus]SDE27145.1 3',5'-cyclic AMP phosphodiesterase CpdA [Paenibacillus sp. cl123]SFW62770.1 3',5'-cyclic AMP phosphodiesterase CpdA [Paenibacillus sp. UNCCL117]
MSHSLPFRQNGTFTIVQFTDIHWKNGSEPDQLSRRLMEQVLEAEQPDLVVFTGDIIYTGHIAPGEAECPDPAQAFRDAVAAVEERDIPWAAVFGNHESEGEMTREELMKVVLEHRHTVTRRGPEQVSGVGNYTLELLDGEGRPAAALYFLDSGNRSPLPHVGGYDWIRRDQIDWLTAESHRLNPTQLSVKLPALAFFHIPLPEYREMWEKEICYGHKQENVCCPQVNSGLFAAMLEMGDVVGTFCGHDHVNDYWGELHGIRLCYGRATGYHTYGKEGFERGARVIRLTAGERGFTTWLRLADGSEVREQPVHHPELAKQS